MKQLTLYLLLISLVNGSDIINKQISISSVDTISHELVYSPSTGKKLSELIWKADDVQMLGIQFDYLASKRWFLHISYKTNLSDNAQMDDYDWLKDGISDWSHWSTHPNTKLDKFTILDISWNNQLKSDSDIQKEVVIGYKIENRAFKAYDGSYIYSSNSGFRDQSGNFSGLGISYEEEFKTLYLGLNLKKYYDRFILSGRIAYSPKVTATNIDTHHNRYFTNNNTFADTTMKELSANVEYPINKSISLALNYLRVDYDETEGMTTRTYYDGATEATPGTVWRYSGAGISNSYSSMNVGLIARF